MDTDSGSSLLTGLICLVPFFFFFAIFAGFAFLLFWVLRRQFTAKSASTLASEIADMESQVNELKERLRLWSPTSLTDLSTDWDAHWTSLGRDLSAHGTIPSLSDPKGPPLVAFSLRVRAGQQWSGQMLASTSDRTLYYRLTQSRTSIDLDGIPFGRITADGSLTDSNGQSIGSARRPSGVPFTIALGTFAKKFDTRERAFPVRIGGRTVANVANPPVRMLNLISIGKQEFAPAVVFVDSVSETEKTWLLTLAVLQVAGFNLAETVYTQPTRV